MGTDGGDAAHRQALIVLSSACRGWARTAHYVTALADDGEVQLRSEVGAPSRYFIRRRGVDRLELTESDLDGGMANILCCSLPRSTSWSVTS